MSARNLILGDAQADRVVPPSGFTAQLTLFVAGAMAFLTVFALALSVASGRLADRWADELAGAATLRINAPADQRQAQTEAAVTILNQTPGVANVRVITPEEQAAMLSPWFGSDLPIDSLPVPQLVEVLAANPPYDATGLRLRLQAEVPGAVLDDHTRWREPLVDAARALRRLAVVSILLIGGATAAMITLAANAALAANSQVIEVLRLVGAMDTYIAQAFIRRFTLRALLGAAVGVACGMIGVLLLPAASEEGGFLTGLGFSGLSWLLPLAIPPLGALVAFVATSRAAKKRLGELT
ncbi:cell division protein FtsX [Epibacterium sp. SM1979]|uniref:Cell division protein FtsX n=1 Tax=Tritonibacter litoralis TaxID=2662264 RepID=A0A843YCP2_9RHOB|nr:cell division protein FtsX [Tritonibacter litoralis]MQQ08776.1 cell division protein FtsX [Tritonibacter litoralis]